MELYDAIYSRRTIRQFSNEPISDDILRKIIQAALTAPSPNNSKPWKIIAIKNKNLISEMKRIVENKLETMFPNLSESKKEKLNQVKTFSTIFSSAPVVLAIMLKPYKAVIDDLAENTNYTHDQLNAIRKFPDIQSTGALVQNILLGLTAEGLCGVWISGALVAGDELTNLLTKDNKYKLQTLIAVGKPAYKVQPNTPVNLTEYYQVIE